MILGFAEVKKEIETINLRLDHHAWKLDVDELKQRVGKIAVKERLATR